MSGSNQSTKTRKQRSTEISQNNPLVDVTQMEEAGKLLDSLAAEGVKRRGYAICSPYERVGVKHDTRRGT
jgi:hypothetical protein